ncbi:MAG: MopE-related protein [Myxococcota bacterium]
MHRHVALLLLALGLAACRSSVNPDQGRFSCTEDKDCGAGWECRPQFAGGALCFRDGECVDTETCNGSDENCDGRVDESFPEEGNSCLTSELGECAAGSVTCVVGALACQRLKAPTAEACNGLDDNCDGRVDEAFDFSSDEAHCGGCSRACDAGTSCLSGVCDETRCDDGVDNDLDSRPDCEDDGCFGQPCLTPMPPTRRCGVVTADAGAGDGGLDGGTDGGLDGGPDGGPDAGQVRGCFPPESECANGADDDGDGLVDCADLDCDGRTCFSGTMCAGRVCPGPG